MQVSNGYSQIMSKLIQAGDKVRIRTLQDRGQEPMTARVGHEAVVLARRVVDGSGVGYIVKFSDQTTGWFFGEELEGF
jgi:hypothetical protein